MQGEVSEVMSAMQKHSVQVAIPMLPAMPKKLLASHNGRSEDREDAVSFAESSVSERSVPSEVSMESGEDISSILLPSFASVSDRDDETDMVQDETSSSSFAEKVVGGKK